MKIICKSVKDCKIAAEKILGAYPDEKIFAFYGKMGSGKTTLITAFCKCLGAVDIPKSPSFAIINEYYINSSVLKDKSNEELPRTQNSEIKTNKIFHLDFYRINKEEEAYNIGYEEYVYSNNYCFIEWPEKIEKLLPEHFVKIEIQEMENMIRIFKISLI